MESNAIRLVECSELILECILESDAQIAAHLDIAVANNWSEFGTEIFQFVLDKIKENPNHSKWWTYLPIHIQSNTLIGSCGFKGPPSQEGQVELGYEVAETYRNRGYATEITKQLINLAIQDETVKSIITHTLAEENASVRVLQKCGFSFIGELNDPEDGLVWKWGLLL